MYDSFTTIDGIDAAKPIAGVSEKNDANDSFYQDSHGAATSDVIGRNLTIIQVGGSRVQGFTNGSDRCVRCLLAHFGREFPPR